MYKGLLIYQKEDYNKNKWFANQFIQKGEQFNLDIQLVFTEDLSLMIEEGKLSVYKRERMMISPDFVINRSRNSQISLHFELMGCRVFNNSQVTEICNDKAKTHQIINSHGIKSVKTVISYTGTQSVLTYPVVLKTNRGHGGTEVYKVNNQTELTEYRGQLQPDEIILQEMCNNPGIDVRVFILGGEIIGAVKRYSSNNFRSNFSLGGRAERYNLSFDQRALVDKIGKILDFDFVGIDFLVDHDGEFLFNEIEDAVGTRTLYQQYDYDVVHMYLEYIAKQMMN